VGFLRMGNVKHIDGYYYIVDLRDGEVYTMPALAMTQTNISGLEYYKKSSDHLVIHSSTPLTLDDVTARYEKWVKKTESRNAKNTKPEAESAAATDEVSQVLEDLQRDLRDQGYDVRVVLL
jgi:hypothetical protein